jgi:hypothetical protein
LNHLIIDEDCVLFEIELHPGEVAVELERAAEDRSGNEVVIAASTGFRVDSVEPTDVSIPAEDGSLNLFHLPIVRLSYFLHWYDFDVDQHLRRAVREGRCQDHSSQENNEARTQSDHSEQENIEAKTQIDPLAQEKS